MPVFASPLNGVRAILGCGILLCAVVWLAGLVTPHGWFPLILCGFQCLAWWLVERHLAVASQTVATPAPVVRSDAAFLSTMGHDLRQPVQAAALFAATLSTHPLPEASRKLVDGIESAVEQLSEQFESVFAIAKLEAGRVEFRPVELGLDAAFAQAVAARLDDAHERELHLRHASTSRRALADPEQLQRLLDRLIAHALQTTTEGGILLGCRRRNDAIVVELRDSGRGMNAEQLADVFVPGGRAAQDLPDRGLGLVLAERLARNMGGRLEVISAPGRGSLFKLWLPAAAS